jgi:membrane protein
MATATEEAVRAELPGALRELVRSFRKRRLLVWASALSFNLVTAVVPFLLFALGLIGFVHLDGVWADIAKSAKPHMSKAAFTVVNDTADKVLHQKQVFWVTIGFAIAIWQVSGGIRTIMGGLSSIYECDDERSWAQRLRRSLVLALIVSALVLTAIGAIWLTPLVYGDVGQPFAAVLFVARWGVAGVCLGLATGLTVRMAPDGYQPPAWVSAGTTIVVSAWILTSILFGLYIRFVASYGSIFGNLATIVVLFVYIYISSIVFFAGAQVDAIIRRRVEGNAQGR